MFIYYPIPYVGAAFAIVTAMVNFKALTNGEVSMFLSNVFLAIIAGVLIDIFFLLFKKK